MTRRLWLGPGLRSTRQACPGARPRGAAQPQPDFLRAEPRPPPAWLGYPGTQAGTQVGATPPMGPGCPPLGLWPARLLTAHAQSSLVRVTAYVVTLLTGTWVARG